MRWREGREEAIENFVAAVVVQVHEHLCIKRSGNSGDVEMAMKLMLLGFVIQVYLSKCK